MKIKYQQLIRLMFNYMLYVCLIICIFITMFLWINHATFITIILVVVTILTIPFIFKSIDWIDILELHNNETNGNDRNK